jgi:hypothetical protein
MPDIDLDRLERLEKAATSGPWSVATGYASHGFHEGIVTGSDSADFRTILKPNWSLPNALGNIEFVAALRNAAPDLIAAARTADAARKDINELIRVIRTTAFFGRGIPEPFGSMFRAIEAKYARKEVGGG